MGKEALLLEKTLAGDEGRAEAWESAGDADGAARMADCSCSCSCSCTVSKLIDAVSERVG